MISAGPSYVLIPGAGGAAWYWHRVVAELGGRGHDVVAVDLPAHDDRAGLTAYADVVLDAAGDRDDLVVVGQSMGAFTAPLVCARRPVRSLVLVNPMIPAPGETGGDWWANTGQTAAQREADQRAGRAPNAEFDPFVYFLHDLPEHLVEESAAHAREQSGTPFGEPWPLASWPDVPTRVVLGRDDRLFPVEFARRVASDRLEITPEEIPGGHLVALSRPVEVADRIEGRPEGAGTPTTAAAW